MSRSAEKVLCDANECNSITRWECVCHRCVRESDRIEERFHACEDHRSAVSEKHMRMRGKEAEWIRLLTAAEKRSPTRPMTFKMSPEAGRVGVFSAIRLCSPIVGPVDEIRLSGKCQVKEVRVGLTSWLTEKEARRVLDPLATLSTIYASMFSETHIDGVTHLRLPIARQRQSLRDFPAGWIYPGIAVDVFVEVLADGPIEAELDVLPDPVLTRPIGCFRMTVDTTPVRGAKIEELALELERLAHVLRTERPLDGAGRLAIDKTDIGAWSLDQYIDTN